ncbi:MAG: DNA-binding transcriptional regulator, partial [Verrucomicrobiota bacterium]
MPESRRLQRVALLIETHRTYTREILRGVRRWMAEHGTWSTFLELGAAEMGPPAWLRHWDGDGILSRTFTAETADVIRRTELPTVELRATRFGQDLPFVGMDNGLIGQMVAEHFLNRGYRNFGVYTLASEQFFEQRVQNFVRALERKGWQCSSLPSGGDVSPEDWESSQEQLIRWLEGLRHPVGVFATNDQLGVRVLDACQRAGLGVPEDVAVVGTENEETLCEFATPPLTSVRFDGEQVGYEAARLLDHRMRGERGAAREVLVPPKGMVVRASSDDFVIEDRLVAHAARKIREQAAQGIHVEDVCQVLAVSRSTLERRMKASLGRTPKEEILRVRFQIVERLLRET